MKFSDPHAASLDHGRQNPCDWQNPESAGPLATLTLDVCLGVIDHGNEHDAPQRVPQQARREEIRQVGSPRNRSRDRRRSGET